MGRRHADLSARSALCRADLHLARDGRADGEVQGHRHQVQWRHRHRRRAVSKPEAAIGLVSAEVADANRATVRTLAFQHKGQRCGYWPDSSATAFDKKNVRDGTYHIWSPIHFYAHVDASKKATNPGVARFVGYFTGEVAAPAGVDVLAIESKSGAIPRCAMTVWRDADLGDVRRYQPEKPCGCFFESVAAGKTSCQACTNDTSCPSSAPKCNYGFCEAR